MMNNDVKDQSIRDSVTQSFLKDSKTAAITVSLYIIIITLYISSEIDERMLISTDYRLTQIGSFLLSKRAAFHKKL